MSTGSAQLRRAADVVVVGSGINSLVCAALLARRGWEVVVLERAEELGGAVRSAELTLPGFRHDVFSTWHPLFVARPRCLHMAGEGARVVVGEDGAGHRVGAALLETVPAKVLAELAVGARDPSVPGRARSSQSTSSAPSAAAGSSASATGAPEPPPLASAPSALASLRAVRAVRALLSPPGPPRSPSDPLPRIRAGVAQVAPSCRGA